MVWEYECSLNNKNSSISSQTVRNMARGLLQHLDKSIRGEGKPNEYERYYKFILDKSLKFTRVNGQFFFLLEYNGITLKQAEMSEIVNIRQMIVVAAIVKLQHKTLDPKAPSQPLIGTEVNSNGNRPQDYQQDQPPPRPISQNQPAGNPLPEAPLQQRGNLQTQLQNQGGEVNLISRELS